MGQHGEGDGLLGVRVNAVIRRRGDRDAGQEAAQVRHDLRVVHASAGHDELGWPNYRTLRPYTHGDGCAVNTVAVAIRSGSGAVGLPEARDELRAVLFAPGALGRLAAVVGITQQFVQQRAV